MSADRWGTWATKTCSCCQGKGTEWDGAECIDCDGEGSLPIDGICEHDKREDD